jgi:hypothetical protein
MSAQVILDALIALNQAEDEASQMKRLSPRIKAAVDLERRKIPGSILAHHDRMRSRGRRSTVAVRHDVCSGCHISIAQGLRSRLRHKLDLNVCENCGSYMYLVEEIALPIQVFTAPPSPARKIAALKTRVPKSTAPVKSKKRLALAR